MFTQPIVKLLGLLLAFLLSSVFILIPLGERDFSPADLGILRFALAGLVFMALFVTGAVRYRPIRRGDRARLAGMVASIIVGQFLLNYVVLHIPAAAASLIVQTAPLLTLVTSVIAGVERFRFPVVAGMGIALSGTAVLIFRSAVGGEGDLAILPLMAAVLVPVAIAAYNFLGKTMAQRYGPANATGQVLVASAALMPAGVLLNPGLLPRAAAAGLTAWLAVLGLALPATVFAYLLWASLLRRMSRSQVASLMYLVPVFAVGMAVTVLGEQLDTTIVAGGLLVLAGLFVIDRGTKRAEQHESGRVAAE